jgi:hypothetical protein
MTATKRSLAGGLVLLAAVVLMADPHWAAWHPASKGWADAMTMHPGMGMGHAMPWFMALGPLAMVLALTGVVFLLASVMRLATKTA